ENVIGLGYTLMFLTHSDKALEIEKFKRTRENKIEFAYDYGNLNASYVNEKINFDDDCFQEIINSDFEKIDSPFQQTSSLKPYVSNVILEKIIIDLEDEVVVEKECDKVENPTVISPGMFKLNLNTFSSVRKPKNTDVIWKKKGSSNTYDVDLSVIVHICLWIIDSGCSNHMTSNRALLANFVEKFLGTVRFGNKDFSVIASYGDVVIDGVDFLSGDCLSNLYTIALNEVASNSSTCLLAKASSSQSWLWHQRLSHLNFATINNHVKNNLVQGLPKMKFEKDHLCSACEQGKIRWKHHKSKTAFASNKPLYLLHMDLCGPMRVQSINGKRYVLVVVDDYSRYTWVFFLHSKDEASEAIISFIKKTQVNLQLQVQHV
nr:hypothetical protein [Tanacetum cinerariifolium]